MKRASIDIGSNSILLLIAQVSEEGIVEIVDESRITFLGKGIDKTGSFDGQSLKDSYRALEEYKEILRDHDISPENCVVTATEAARVAKDSREFIRNVASQFGLNIQLISGDGEAFYTAYGVSASCNDQSFVIMDIGGASTELIKVQKEPFHIIDSISLPIGASRAIEWIQDEVFLEKFNSLMSVDIKDRFSTDKLVCVAGCMTSIGAMYLNLSDFQAKKVNDTIISNLEFKKFIEKYSKYTPEKLLSEFPFLGKRAKVMKGGEQTAVSFIEALSVKQIQICTYGLRYGTLLKGKIDEQFMAR